MTIQMLQLRLLQMYCNNTLKGKIRISFATKYNHSAVCLSPHFIKHFTNTHLEFILELSNNTSHNPTDSKKIEFQATKIQEIKSENEQLKYKVNKLEKRLREWEDWRSDLYSSKKVSISISISISYYIN